MKPNFVDVLVIGGGVIGLAIAKSFAAKGREVIVLEKENTLTQESLLLQHHPMKYPNLKKLSQKQNTMVLKE